MKTLFHLLFYKFFNHNKRIGNVNNDDFYAFKSVAFLSVLVFLNLLSLPDPVIISRLFILPSPTT